MKIYELIFSKDPVNRIKRHLLFWTVVFLYHLVRISLLFPPNQFWENPKPILLGALIWGLLGNMIISYSIVYYLIPNLFQKRKYLLFVLGIIGVILVLFGFGLVNHLLNKQMASAIGTTAEQPYIFLKGTLIRLFGNPPLICGFLLSLKTLKNWHLKQLENETLMKEKSNAELQLLKAQIHPHFLFNTLNNIYSFTLSKSPQASGLVQKLSDMLHYMITDCDQSLVPLEKELRLLRDYLGLEKVRYGKRLQIQMQINGQYKDKLIAPLLLSPFVENCFKHGASIMRKNAWVQLIININGNYLHFNLSNSKPVEPVILKNSGIGLTNVRKRLNLIYPRRYQLEIHTTDNTYTVYLKVELQRQEVTNHQKAVAVA